MLFVCFVVSVLWGVGSSCLFCSVTFFEVRNSRLRARAWALPLAWGSGITTVTIVTPFLCIGPPSRILNMKEVIQTGATMEIIGYRQYVIGKTLNPILNPKH